jgi:PhnB protein
MTDVVSYLCVDGASDALEWYARALGAEELYRLAMPDGRVGHAEMSIGGTRLMLSDEWPEGGVLGPKSRGGTTVSFAVTVDDVDALHAMWQRAVDAGATVERQPADQFYGYRAGTLLDPFGHRWTINAKLEDVDPAEMQRRIEATDGAEV